MESGGGALRAGKERTLFISNDNWMISFES